MEEDILKISEDIVVSSTFKKIQSKNLFSSAMKIDKKNEETCNNLSKDFENNQNNSYNINNASLDFDEELYFEDFEDEDSNILLDKNIEKHNGEKLPLKEYGLDYFLEENKSKDNALLPIDSENVKEENSFFDIGENLDSCDNAFELYSQKELNYDFDNKEDKYYLNNNDKKDLFAQEKSKNTLLQSKSNFDIGNIYYSDYNDETIISNTSVDDKKNLVNKKEIEKNEHLNDNKSFYELNVEEMPNRRNLLKELYKDDLVGSTEQNGVQKQKTKEIKVLGKIFKRSEK